MAEYIEREALIAEIQKNISTYWNEGSGGYYLAEDALNYSVKTAPTADVVPKSEVEKLNKEIDTLAEEHSDLIVEKDQLFDIAEKQKVEIEALKIANDKMYSAIEEIKAEVAREIFEEIEKALNLSKCYGESGIYFEQDIETDIAELKKKYM